MAPEILTEIFPQKESNYSLRNSTTLQGRSTKTVMYGSETISILGPKREWAPKNCPCRLCNWICVSYLYVHILFCKLKYFKHM